MEYDTIINFLKSLTDEQVKTLFRFVRHAEFFAKLKKEDDPFTFLIPRDLSFEFDLVNEKTRYPILIIEEPEANLHPNLQAKLADVLVLANKTYGVHFLCNSCRSPRMIGQLHNRHGRSTFRLLRWTGQKTAAR